MGPQRGSGNDVVVRGPSSVARLLLELDDQWPTLGFLGFGFYYAWIWLSYDSSVLLPGVSSNGTGPGTDTTFFMYLASTTALALMLILAAVFSVLSTRIVRSRLATFTMAAVATLGTVGVRVTAELGARHPLFLACCALTGLGTAWVALRLGAVYASVPARKAAMRAAASFVLAALLYFLVRGLPGELSLVVMACLPLGAALCTMTTLGDAVVGQDYASGSRSLPTGLFFRLVLAIVVFSLVVGVTRGFSMLTQSSTVLDDQGSLVVFGMASVALALYVAVGLLGNDFDISRLYYPVIILAAAGILIVPLLGGAGLFGGVVVGVAYACFVMVMWCLFAHVSHVTGASAVRVFGLGRGASALGTTAGWLAGSGLMGSLGEDPSSTTIVCVIMVFVLFVVSMLVFNDRAIGMALRTASGDRREKTRGWDGPVGDESDEGDCADAPAEDRPDTDDTPAITRDGTTSDGAAGQAFGEGGGAEGGDDGDRPRLGAWSRSCREVAERFGLSQRETDVLFLLAKGRTIGFIAEDLHVSFNTAKSHIRHVYVKTGVHTRQELLDLVERGRIPRS